MEKKKLLKQNELLIKYFATFLNIRLIVGGAITVIYPIYAVFWKQHLVQVWNSLLKNDYRPPGYRILKWDYENSDKIKTINGWQSWWLCASCHMRLYTSEWQLLWISNKRVIFIFCVQASKNIELTIMDIECWAMLRLGQQDSLKIAKLHISF